MNIQHVIWEFKNKKNATETSKKIFVYGQSVITDCKVQNWFSKFCSGHMSLRDERRAGSSLDLNPKALKELVECSLYKNTQELTQLQYITIHNLPPLEKVRKSKQA